MTPLVDNIEPTAEQREEQQADVAAWAAGVVVHREPWFHHGPRWIRRVLHLKHRAERAGLEISFDDLQVAGPVYCLSMPHNYEVELGCERRR